jgi:hypothetical protein
MCGLAETYFRTKHPDQELPVMFFVAALKAEADSLSTCLFAARVQ